MHEAVALCIHVLGFCASIFHNIIYAVNVLKTVLDGFFTPHHGRKIDGKLKQLQ